MRSRNRSPETIEKMRNAALNRTPETRAKIGDASRGRKHTDETKARISKVSIENYKNMSSEKKERMRRPGEKNGMYGKKHTEKALSLITEKMRNRTPETRAKLREANSSTVVALNIKTGIVTRVSSEVFYANSEIYFGPRSKEYQDWKSSQNLQPTK